MCMRLPSSGIFQKADALPKVDELKQYALKYGYERKWISGYIKQLNFTSSEHRPCEKECIVKDIDGITPYRKLVYNNMWILRMLLNGLEFSVPFTKGEQNETEQAVG